MSFVKHVGTHNKRKVVILFRQVPNEDHMCLVAYSDSLPRLYHDDVMKVLESPSGQQAKELSDVLSRNMFADGKVMLNALHTGGYIKKIQTSQVIVTPTNTSSVRLDELNDIMNKMAMGEEATEKLRTMDQSRGLRDPAKHTRPIKESKGTNEKPLTAADINSVLSEDSIAADLENQAARMEAEAKGLLAEAKRLKDEAKSLKPAKPARVSNGKKQKVTQA
jgi:hypothetical protein